LVSCVPHAGNDGADLVVEVDYVGGVHWAYSGNGIGGDEYRFIVLSDDPTSVTWTVDFGPVQNLGDGTLNRVPIPSSLVIRTTCGAPAGRLVAAEW
jgi:hypothetical protein